MRILIAGGGRTGLKTAKTLAARNNMKVTLIDLDPKTCERISHKMHVNIVCGDVTSPQTLEKMGITETDVFIALTNNERINSLCALLAKSYGVKKIFAKVREPQYAEACRKLGVVPVDTPKIISNHICAQLLGDDLFDFIEKYSDAIELKVMKVGNDSDLIGNEIGKIELKKKTHIIGIVRNGTLINPTYSGKIESGDLIAMERKKKHFGI